MARGARRASPLHERGERALALVLLLASAPLLAALSLFVLLVDGPPVLQRGERLGLRRRSFLVLQLRTLRRGVEPGFGDLPAYARARLEIPGGRLLRAARLDELPQLWNVVRGQMALVGPRPERIRLFQARREPSPEHEPPVDGRPGLLGPSQLYTPPASPRRIRTWLDRAWAGRERRTRAAAGLALLTAFAAGRKLATQDAGARRRRLPITGTRFFGTSSVRFAGTAAESAIVSSTQVRAAVPAGATTGRISLTTPGGTATSAGAFTVTQPPSIASFSPASGPVGTSVSVTGAGFSRASSVRFNGTPAGFTVVSGTLIRTTAPAGATTGRISVTTPDGTATSATDFRVTHPPGIDAFLPPTGVVLTPVTITGRSFSGATGVHFNGKPAAFTVVNSGLILTSVPVGATTGRISVTTPGGTATSASSFVVIGL